MDDNGWFGKIVQQFGPWFAAWSAFLLNVGMWFKIKNERLRDQETERENGWDRLREELELARSDRDVVSEERDLLRDRMAEKDNIIAELKGELAEKNGILQGYGEWRQYQAYRDALKRAADE